MKYYNVRQLDQTDCVAKLFARCAIKSLTNATAWAVGNAFGLIS